MITDQDTEIIEREESTHLRLTPEFMKSIGVDVVDTWNRNFFMVYVPKSNIRFPNGENIVVHPADSVLLSREVWCDVKGYRIFGKIHFYSSFTERYMIIVVRVDKLTNLEL